MNESRNRTARRLRSEERPVEGQPVSGTGARARQSSISYADFRDMVRVALQISAGDLADAHLREFWALAIDHPAPTAAHLARAVRQAVLVEPHQGMHRLATALGQSIRRWKAMGGDWDQVLQSLGLTEHSRWIPEHLRSFLRDPFPRLSMELPEKHVDLMWRALDQDEKGWIHRENLIWFLEFLKPVQDAMESEPHASLAGSAGARMQTIAAMLEVAVATQAGLDCVEAFWTSALHQARQSRRSQALRKSESGRSPLFSGCQEDEVPVESPSVQADNAALAEHRSVANRWISETCPRRRGCPFVPQDEWIVTRNRQRQHKRHVAKILKKLNEGETKSFGSWLKSRETAPQPQDDKEPSSTEQPALESHLRQLRMAGYRDDRAAAQL